MLDLITDTMLFGFAMMIVLIVVSPVREYLLSLELEDYFDSDTTGISYNIIHLLLLALWFMIPGLNLVLLMLLNIALLVVILLIGANIVSKIFKLDIDTYDAWMVFVLMFVMVTIIKPITYACNYIQPSVDKLFRDVMNK